MKPNTNYYEGESERTTQYPSEWPQNKGLGPARKRLSRLWVELDEDSEEPQSPESQEPEHQNTHAGNKNSENDARQEPENKDGDGDGDGDVDMRSHADSSENRADSNGPRESSASANSSSSDGRNDSSNSKAASASTKPEGEHWLLFNSKVKGLKRWILIKFKCCLYGCDFANISFHYKIYYILKKPDTFKNQLLDIVQRFIMKCLAAL